MSPRPLQGVDMPGYDIGVVWDYRDMSAPWIGDIARYEEIVVVAWSFGVHAASRFMAANQRLHITARIAVNGTRFTADDLRGIPRAIFDATLAGLNERGVTKFNMRMCGGAAAYKDFANHAPVREVAELRDELEAFDVPEAPFLLWDKAFVSQGDLIIPPANQLRAWETDAVQTIMLDGPHLPDFNHVLRMSLTDKSHVEQRFRRAESTYNDNASVQLMSAAKLLDLTAEYLPILPQDVLEIGCGTGSLTSMLMERFEPSRLMLWDLHIAPQIEAMHRQATKFTAVSCDAETGITKLPDSSSDLIISASTVQWFNSLRRFLSEAARVLRPGGVIALSTYGPDTMREIHEALGTSSRFASPYHLRRMVPSSLAVESLSEERHTTVFDTPLDVLRHMSRTGVNGLTPSATASACRLMKKYPLDSEGKAPLTYNPIYIILRKL